MRCLRPAFRPAALCFLALTLASCVSVGSGIRPGPTGFFSHIRSLIADPFADTDPIGFSRAVAAEALAEHRVRPATTKTNRRLLTLADCRTLALTNNLDIRMAEMEQFAKNAIGKSNASKLLPHLLGTGDLGLRDNQAFSYSEVLGQEGVTPRPGATGGTGVNQFSTGRDRTSWRYTVETRWSPTDAALAYYLTRNSRNDERKQRFTRLRTAQKLVGVVDSSFARLLCLQTVLPLSQELVGIRQQAVSKTEKLFAENLTNVEDLHRRRDKLIKAERMWEGLRHEAEHQRNLLATAMHLSPDYAMDGGFCLQGEVVPPCFTDEVSNMEFTAVRNRPESYAAGLDHLNSVNDLKRTLVKYCPKVTGFWRYTRDQDKHQYNRDWKDVGLMASVDLVEWCGTYWESRAVDLLADKTYKAIGAVAMTIASEVRVTAIRYFDAMSQLDSARRSLASVEQVLKINQERAVRDALQGILLLEAKADMVSERIALLKATGEAQALLSELQSAMGTNYSEHLTDK
jgi:outer membrane protein TolC